MKQNQEKSKRVYQEPRIEKVELIADEAVLTNCKGVGIFGKNETGCRPYDSSCKFTHGS